MQLIVKDFAKIKEANLKFEGLTIIAGDNNTGKSTVGKILFTMFHQLRNMPQLILKDRKNSIEQFLFNSRIGSELATPNFFQDWQKISQIIGELQPGDNVVESWYAVIAEKMKQEFNEDLSEEASQNLRKRIKGVWTHLDSDIEREIVRRSFADIFAGQMNPFGHDGESMIQLEVQKKVKQIKFISNQIGAYCSEIDLREDAIYVDDPFIVDECYKRARLKPSTIKTALIKYLESDFQPTAVDTIELQEKLADINQLLGKTISGNILHKENRLVLALKDQSGELNVENWSAGIKSFAILKRLLENNSLKEHGVLILDEPEIHLHPQWQVTYAEIIVLLQKTFNLTVLLTTHSPFFLDAIEVFAYKHDIVNQTNYYLSEKKKDGIRFREVTNHIDQIYEKMSNPTQELENIRAELQMGR